MYTCHPPCWDTLGGPPPPLGTPLINYYSSSHTHVLLNADWAHSRPIWKCKLFRMNNVNIDKS